MEILLGFLWYEYLVLLVMGIFFIFALIDECPLGILGVAIFGGFYHWTGAEAIIQFSSLLSFLFYMLFYAPAGFLWAYFKWILVVKREIRKGEEGAFSKEKVLSNIEYKKSTKRIFYWALVWPLSVLNYFLSEFLEDLYNSFKEYISTLSNRVTNSIIEKSNLK